MNQQDEERVKIEKLTQVLVNANNRVTDAGHRISHALKILKGSQDNRVTDQAARAKHLENLKADRSKLEARRSQAFHEYREFYDRADYSQDPGEDCVWRSKGGDAFIRYQHLDDTIRTLDKVIRDEYLKKVNDSFVELRGVLAELKPGIEPRVGIEPGIELRTNDWRNFSDPKAELVAKRCRLEDEELKAHGCYMRIRDQRIAVQRELGELPPSAPKA